MNFYHGTPSEKRALNILKEGIHPNLSETQGLSRPVDNHVYLSKNMEYAVIYLLGAHMAGSKLPKNLITERYGYLFVVSKAKLKEIQPDEDQIGQALYDQKIPSLNEYKELLKNAPPLEEDFSSLWDEVCLGDYSAWIKAGHILLEYLSEDQKLEIIEMYGNVAHKGHLIPDEAWKFDKKLCEKLKPDCSNFFELAEKIKV